MSRVPRAKDFASPSATLSPGADGAGQDRLAVEEAPQVVGQRAADGVALGRVLLQALQADRLQVARHVAGCRLPGGTGSRVRTCSKRVQHGRARNGGRPVSSS